MGAVNARFLRNRVREFRDCRSRLDCEHVEPGANPLSMDGIHQGALIDHFTTRSVNEVRTVFHCSKKLGPNQHARIRLQGNMNTYYIRNPRDIERRLFSFNAQLFRSLVGETATPGDDGHAKRFSSGNHLLPNFADTDQTERASKQTARF